MDGENDPSDPSLNYERKGIVLVVGAGVSVGSGVPSWDELLGELAASRNATAAIRMIRERGFSPPAIASALQDLYPSRQHFVHAIRTALYRRTPLESDAPSRTRLGQLSKNETLRSVAAFCVRVSDRSTRANSRVHAVVSFNLDELLEAYVLLRYGSTLLRPIKDASFSSAPSMTSVYHIHGHVPVSGAAPSDVVLTEGQYFDAFGEPFGTFTYTFLYLLHEYSCVFIGLSMRDDNLRRLLYYSARERLASIPSARRDEAIQRHYAIMRRESPEFDDIIEGGLTRLGVRTLWVNEHADLPRIMAQVYGVAGDRWSDVF